MACVNAPQIVFRVVSYATNVMYLLKILKKTGNKVTGRKFGAWVSGAPGFGIYDTNLSLYVVWFAHFMYGLTTLSMTSSRIASMCNT